MNANRQLLIERTIYPMKPTALYLISPDNFASVYDSKTQAAISDRIDLRCAKPGLRAIQTDGVALEEIEVVFSGWGCPALQTSLLEKLKKLRIVFHAGGTIRSFATSEMWARGIRVTTAAEVNGEAVANFTVGAILLSLKQAFSLSRKVRIGGGFPATCLPIAGVATGTIALISFGSIARSVTRKLHHFGPRIIVYDPFLDDTTAKQFGVKRVTLFEAFAQADVVSLHSPLLPETRGMIRSEHLSAMGPSATFINTARGPIVDYNDLLTVLRDREDLTALLDVTDPMPPTLNDPLLLLPNVVTTPHIAGSMGSECALMGRFMLDELDRWLKNEKLQGEVTAEQAQILA